MKISAYHGSNSDLTNFSTEFMGFGSKPASDGPGLYFTNSIENGKMWGDKLYCVDFVNANFISSDTLPEDIDRSLIRRILDNIPDEDHNYNYSEDLETDKELFIDNAIQFSNGADEVLLSIYYDYFNGIPQVFMEKMVEVGIDGIAVSKNFDFPDVNKTIHYVVYNTSMIKITNVINILAETIRKTLRKLL